MMSVRSAASDAKAPRQSGLKKPRPLRSMSVQESSSNDSPDTRDDVETNVNTETDSDAPILTFSSYRYQDPRSVDSKASGASVYQRQHSAPAASSTTIPSTTAGHESYQNATASTTSHVSAETPSFYKTKTGSSENLNDSSSRSLTGQRNVVVSEKCSPGSEDSSCTEVAGSGRARYHRGRRSPTLNTDPESKDSGSHLSLQTDPNSVIVTTLLTGKGEELALSGRNMPTILLASRILLNELNASIVKIETYPADMINDEDGDDGDSEMKSTNELPSASSPVEDKPDSPTSVTEKKKPKLNLHYSKQRLLDLSRSKLSRQPPDLWNLLTSTHADCCLPVNKIGHYFDPADFHFHDGTLAVPDSRHQRDRDYKDRYRD